MSDTYDVGWAKLNNTQGRFTPPKDESTDTEWPGGTFYDQHGNSYRNDEEVPDHWGVTVDFIPDTPPSRNN